MNLISLKTNNNINISDFISHVTNTQGNINIYVGNINSLSAESIDKVLSKLPVNHTINIILQNSKYNYVINEKNAIVRVRKGLYTIKLDSGEEYSVYGIYNTTVDFDDLNAVVFDELEQYKSNIILTLMNDEYISSSYDELYDSYQSGLFLPIGAKIKIEYLDSGTRTLIGYVNIQSSKNTYSNDRLLYKVGLVSDIHYNDTDNDLSNNDPDSWNNDGDHSDFYIDLRNAFNVFKECNVDFISCCGDVTTEQDAHLNNFALCYNKYGQGQSFFTTVGNHDIILQNDTTYDGHAYLWHDIDMIVGSLNVNPIRINDSYSITGKNYNDPIGTSYFFEYHDDVYIYFNISYGEFVGGYGSKTKDTTNGSWNTHNPRLLTQSEAALYGGSSVSSTDFHLYNKETVEWLEDILELYSEKRCFIFTHLMFGDGAGTYHGSKYYSYYDTHNDCIRGLQGEYIRSLRQRYPNTIWFGGHSHMEYIWQTVDTESMMTRHDDANSNPGAYTVHIPSLSRPVPIITSYSVDGSSSEFAIMNVYEHHIEIEGYIAKDGANRYAYSIGKNVLYDDTVDPSLIHEFNANDLQYFTWQSYSDDVLSPSIEYVSSGIYEGYLKFNVINYTYFIFNPPELANNNSIYLSIDDIVIEPNQDTSGTYNSAEYSMECLAQELANTPDAYSFHGFGLYSKSTGTYITPTINYTAQNIAKYDTTYGIVFRLYKNGFEKLTPNDTQKSKYDAYMRNVGYTVYMKIRYYLYNIPEKSNYINKKTLFSNYLLNISQ